MQYEVANCFFIQHLQFNSKFVPRIKILLPSNSKQTFPAKKQRKTPASITFLKTKLIWSIIKFYAFKTKPNPAD